MKFTPVLLFLFVSSGLLAQQSKAAPDTLTPLQVVEHYVSPDGFPDKMKYFCCELYQEWHADSTLGQYLPKQVKRNCLLVFQDTGHATVAVWLHDSVISRDIYFYLVKKQNWTIYSARSLVMMDDAEKEIHRLDSLPKKQRPANYAFEYNNLKLWNSSDSLLIAHFKKNQKQFVQLQALLVKKGYYGKTDSLVRTANNNKKIKKKTQQLLIRDFDYDKRYPGCVFYLLGGMVDNTVGYLYQPDASKLPLMTEKHYILIRAIGNGWYLFKTT